MALTAAARAGEVAVRRQEALLYRGLQQTRQRRSVGTESHGRSLRLFTIRPPVVAVSEKISAIWGAERLGPGAK